MQLATTAASAAERRAGACAFADGDGEVRWLEPRPRHALRRSAPARNLRRLSIVCLAGLFGSGLVSTSALAPVGLAQAAIRPSIDPPSLMHAFEDPDDDPLDEALLPPGPPLPVDPAALAREPKDPDDLLQFGSRGVPRRLVATIVNAATATGTDPVYLMALADKESSFSPAIKAPTSSAEGLFQFIDRTWLEMVREYGPKYSLAEEAAAITLVDDKPFVADPAMRERILGLRRSPYLAAVMAAELLKRGRSQIASRIGRDLRTAELYLCHFLGPKDAGRFMELLETKPAENAATAFPAPARANRTLFFTEVLGRKGRKRLRGLSVAEVHERLSRMIDRRLDRFGTVLAYAE